MMEIKIKHRCTGKVLFEAEVGNLRLCVELAVKENADLCNADLRNANLRDADLCNVDLCNANLRDADLRNANLRNANLRDANLRYADLRNANLRDADLCDADLCNTNLCNANLDFSCWPLWCGSLDVKLDEKQKRQLLYHLLAIAPEYRTSELLNEANKFHRIPEVPKLESEVEDECM